MKSSGESMVLEEGGDPKDIQIVSTIPILCQDPSPAAECCLELEASVTSGSQRCPDGSDLDRVEVGDPGVCRPKICREDFNRSVAIPVRVRDDNIVNGDDEVTVHFKVADDSGLWDHVKIPGQKVSVSRITIMLAHCRKARCLSRASSFCPSVHQVDRLMPW